MIWNRSYWQINRLLLSEAMEPVMSWAFRMAFTAIVPVLWGAYTHRMEEASWITLTAECICWVELKGAFSQRMRVVVAGVLLAIFFGILGCITSTSIFWSVIAMLGTAFFAALFKNLGDRGSGLAICVYVIYIIANAFPVTEFTAIQDRIYLILTGGLWALLVNTVFSIFLTQQESYRRSIALVWRANSALLQQIDKGWDGKSMKSSIRDVYLREKDIRTAIDSSLQLFEKLAHQSGNPDSREFHLAQLRKTSSLTASLFIGISEELEGMRLKEIPEDIRLRLHALLVSMHQATERISQYVLSLKPEDALLTRVKISKLNKRIAFLRDTTNEKYKDQMERIALLSGRIVMLMETSLDHLEKMGGDIPVYNSYSLIKTLFILHPQHWIKNIRLIFDLNSLTARYAFRSAVAAAGAIFLYKWLDIEKGYWIAFTVMVVVQPYFGATIRKALERVSGTLAGVLVAGILTSFTANNYLLKVILLFLCFFFMVYSIRKKYAVGVFFITISLVLLFQVESHYDSSLIYIRAFATLAGAVLGITAGFAVLPSWDKHQLPLYFTQAIQANYRYFVHTFLDSGTEVWTRYKRTAELANSNTFDSFNRYMQEPGIGKKIYISYYQLIMHNIRITRELNNIHIELDTTQHGQEHALIPAKEKIVDCLTWFQRIETELIRINPAIKTITITKITRDALSVHQVFYLDKILAELKAIYPDLKDYGKINPQLKESRW